MTPLRDTMRRMRDEMRFRRIDYVLMCLPVGYIVWVIIEIARAS